MQHLSHYYSLPTDYLMTLHVKNHKSKRWTCNIFVKDWTGETKTDRQRGAPSRCWWRGWWWRREDPAGGRGEAWSQPGVGTDMIGHPLVPGLSTQNLRPRPSGRYPSQRCRIPSMKTVKWWRLAWAYFLIAEGAEEDLTCLSPHHQQAGLAQVDHLHWEPDRQTERRADRSVRGAVLTWGHRWKGQNRQLF